jgi:lipopolysaccharide/colanic/teichoic acid biosynthesis glycosyltransferase
LWLERALSVGVALVGLVALSPVIGAIAIAIRLDSPGPVLFVQERVGRAGRRFPLRKFRTMYVTEAEHSEWARDNADRITRVGLWLRRFRLDELPQFVNVLRGDMDLVGPRPHPFSNFSLFVTVLRNSPECGEQIPYYSIRSMARPGITGWAQVRYRYANNLEEEIEKMRYDLYYVKHRSFWLDLRILADTVKTVLGGRESLEAVPEPRAAAGTPRPLRVAPRPQ